MTHEEFTGVTSMTLTHPEPGLQGHRSFPSSVAQKQCQIYRKKCIFYDSGDYRQDNSLC